MEQKYDSYEIFAQVYDEFMDNVPYDEWTEFYVKKLKQYGIENGLICDLGCGTGAMTMRLADEGFDMIGVDSSEEMLLVAREKEAFEDLQGKEKDILYLCQDMREFELYGTVRACISVCDCVNYVLDKNELTQVFRLVNNYLDPNGIFIFDFNTTYKYKEVIGDTVIAENREDCSFIWENFYNEEAQINEYDLTIFAKCEENFFQKYTETHFQRGYTIEQMKQMIEKAGLIFVEAIDMDTQSKPCATSQRICVVARECGKWQLCHVLCANGLRSDVATD